MYFPVVSAGGLLKTDKQPYTQLLKRYCKDDNKLVVLVSPIVHGKLLHALQ